MGKSVPGRSGNGKANKVRGIYCIGIGVGASGYGEFISEWIDDFDDAFPVSEYDFFNG